jgi:DNA-binding response OmpR family regulator
MARILVIDDQNDVRAVICMVLQVNRFEVVEAASAAAGLKAFAQGRFDVVVVDILLEDATGYDVIAALRERAPELPIVAVSGLISLDLDVQTANLSNVVCLRKPFRPSELIRAVGTARAAAPNTRLASAGGRDRIAVGNEKRPAIRGV